MILVDIAGAGFGKLQTETTGVFEIIGGSRHTRELIVQCLRVSEHVPS